MMTFFRALQTRFAAGWRMTLGMTLEICVHDDIGLTGSFMEVLSNRREHNLKKVLGGIYT